METLNDWWEGSLGVEYENTHVLKKRTADVYDPDGEEHKSRLAADLMRGARRGGQSGGGQRGHIRQPELKPTHDDDGWTQKMVDKMFREQRAGVTGKQTAGSQTMFKVCLSAICCSTA
jgi:hypothetical protein